MNRAKPASVRLSRRQLLRAGIAGALGTLILPAQFARAEAVKRRAAVIGHTGFGDYGHGLDRIFEGRANTELVATADADPAALTQAKERLHAPQTFAKYSEMLEEVRPDLVCVAPRQAREHYAMVLSALRV